MEEETTVTVGSAIGQQAGSALPWECDWISSVKCLPLWEAPPHPHPADLVWLKANWCPNRKFTVEIILWQTVLASAPVFP